MNSINNQNNNKDIIKHNTNCREIVEKDKTINDIERFEFERIRDEKDRILHLRKKEWELEWALKSVNSWYRKKSFNYELFLKNIFHEVDYSDYMNNFNNARGMKFHNYLVGKVESGYHSVFNHSEKIKQLFEREMIPSSECGCFDEGWEPLTRMWEHLKLCLKTDQEIDEWIQKTIKAYKKIWKVFERELLEEKGIVWEYEEPQFDDYFLDRFVEEEYLICKGEDKIPSPCCDGKSPCKGDNPFIKKLTDANKKTLGVWEKQKRLNIKKMKNQSIKKPVSLQSDQINIVDKNIKIDKTTLITRLKVEITELKKNLNPDDEQKVVLAQKEVELAKLEGEREQKQISNVKKDDNPTKVIIPVGIVSILLLISIFWVVKKRKSLKKH